MEEFLKLQRTELLQQGAPDSDDEDWDDPQWPEEREDSLDVEENNSLEDADLAFITSILESFSKPKSKTKPTESFCATFTPEGAPMQAKAKQVTPPKFNQKLTIKTSAAEKFSCFPTIEKEGAGEFTEETQSEIDAEEVEFENPLHGICSITEDKRNPFAAWQPLIPQKPVFQNSHAQPWWSVSSPPEYSSLEPTLTSISMIDYLTLEDAIKPTLLPVSTPQISHQMKQTPQHSGKLCMPTTRRYRNSWNKHWTELNKTSKRTRNSRNKSHDHPEQSKPSRPWKQRLPSLDRTNMNQNTKCQNMPPETDAGNAHQLFTQCPFRICSSTASNTNTTRTRSWGTRWRKWSNKIPTCTRDFQCL
jgi:hypothetical protein